jgi:hypothetical protein
LSGLLNAVPEIIFLCNEVRGFFAVGVALKLSGGKIYSSASQPGHAAFNWLAISKNQKLKNNREK